MNPQKRYINLNLSVTLGFIFIGFILFKFFFSDFFHFLYPVMLIVSLILNLVSYKMNSVSDLKGMKGLQVIMKTFFLRFIVYIGIVVFFILSEKLPVKRLAFILALFIVYIVYSSVEVTGIVNLIKKKK